MRKPRMLEQTLQSSFQLCALCLTLAASSHAAQPVAWDFESEQIDWTPRMKTIVVERAEGVSATAVSKASVRIHGPIDGGWNYAVTGHHPMKAGQIYRLSVWVRVDRVGRTTPMPYLKCEFVAADRGRVLGRAETERYDSSRMGEWQNLAGEFRAPDGTEQCWLALEKGGNGPMEIDAYLDDVLLEPIAALSVIEQYRLNPIPPPLEKMRGVHPRIYLTRAHVAELREAIKTTHASLWEEVREMADSAVRRGPPAYRKDDGRSGDEQLWQRSVGNTMPHLAMAWALTGDRKYLDSARAWALASCGYETWGLGRIDGMDLAAGHQLFGLGIVYDWCYDDLGEEARRTIRETLVRRASAMFETAATEKAWWRRSYLQNHLWVDICGMSIAGFALFDEVDDASKWIGLPLDKFRRTMDALGDDGASHEGVGYWQYGVEYMLKFMHLARTLLDVDMFDNDWWRNTATYAQHLALPRNAWTRRSSSVDIADCPRSNWYGPDYLLRGLARQYRDGHAQWLARQVDEADIDSPGARWLNLVWYDPALEPKPPADRPTMHHFEDMGIVSSRSDWSGDESLFVFKCGPFIGHKAVERFSYDPGGGHVHPDANHFVVFGEGEWLIRDDGYRAKWTGQHNTLLVNGRGQLGEGRKWFNGSAPLRVKARPRVLRAVSTAQMDHIVGDATEEYPAELGLRSYIRHLLFVKPDVLIVVDDITLDRAREIELRFHPEQSKADRGGRAFVARGKTAVLRLESLTPEDVAIAAEGVRTEGREGDEDTTMYTIRLRTERARWRNAVALSWSSADGAPKKVTFQETDDVWTFLIADRSVSLSLTALTAKIGR